MRGSKPSKTVACTDCPRREGEELPLNSHLWTFQGVKESELEAEPRPMNKGSVTYQMNTLIGERDDGQRRHRKEHVLTNKKNWLNPRTSVTVMMKIRKKKVAPDHQTWRRPCEDGKPYYRGGSWGRILV